MSTKIYSYGHNLAGCLPESSPYLTTSWQSAHDSLVDDIVQHMNSLYDALKTHKYFESGREEWTPERILEFADQYEDGFPCYVMDGQWETVLMTDSDKLTLKDIAECEKALRWIGANVDPDTQFSVTIGYYNYWLQEAERDETLEGIEGDELEARIEAINQEAY